MSFSAPAAVRSALRKGIALVREGYAGKGLRGKTVEWAERLANGEPIDYAKAKKMRGWFARHGVAKAEAAKRLRDPKSPAAVAYLLWGGTPSIPFRKVGWRDPVAPWLRDVIAKFESQRAGRWRAERNGLARLDIDSDGGAAALRVALEDAVGEFAIIMVEAPVGKHQEAVLQRLSALSGVGGVPELSFVNASSTQSLVGLLRDATKRGAGGVVLSDVETHLPEHIGEHSQGSVSGWLHQLNGRRDSIGTILRGPFVIVANAHAMERIAVTMPDFWSWRAFTISARRVD